MYVKLLKNFYDKNDILTETKMKLKEKYRKKFQKIGKIQTSVHLYLKKILDICFI